MKSKLGILLSLFALFLTAGLKADDIKGFWRSVNEKTGKTQCIIAVYEYENKHYGRIIATYDKMGKLEDSLANPKSRAPGVKGQPFYAGLDFIWGLQEKGSRFKGKIMDPEKGKVYNAELWRDKEDLIVRGELFVFGRNQKWPAATESDFTEKFKKPDISEFVPSIPKPK